MQHSIGQQIRRARTLAGLTQQALARKLGTTKQHIWRWEHDQVNPGSKYIEPLARALGVTVAELFGEPPRQGLNRHEKQLLNAARSRPEALTRLLALLPLAQSIDNESWEYLVGLMKKLQPTGPSPPARGNGKTPCGETE